LSKEHLLVKLNEVRAKLMEANEKVSVLVAKVAEQDQELGDKEKKLRSYAMRNVELERKLQQQRLEQGNLISRYFQDKVAYQKCKKFL
jgi:chromosome segregation ATPase